MALLFLYYAPEIELIGITTTHGNGTIATTTRNALYLTERFGIDIPVAQGSGAPLAGAAADPPVFVHGHNGLGDIPLPQNIAKKTDSRPAYRFIIDMVRAHAQEVAIVAVGPLTTLALALRNDPEIAGLVRRLVIMAGAFGYHGHLGNVTPAAEANILSDPHAADETLGGSWPITMVGLDVTQQTLMTTEFLKTLAEEGGEAGRFIWEITRLYEAFHHSAGRAGVYVHDPSAVAYLIDSDPVRHTIWRNPRRHRGFGDRPNDPETRRSRVSARSMGWPPIPCHLHGRRFGKAKITLSTDYCRRERFSS
jgi:purine nucleosidase